MTAHNQFAVRRFRKRQNTASVLVLFLVAALGFIGFACASFLIRGAYDDAKETFLTRLSEEKSVTEINQNLKMELLAITQKGYVEFAAGERLGLKNPDENEVLVLR